MIINLRKDFSRFGCVYGGRVGGPEGFCPIFMFYTLKKLKPESLSSSAKGQPLGYKTKMISYRGLIGKLYVKI